MAKKVAERKKLGDHIEQLPVALTNDELLDFGQRLARLQSQLAEHLANEAQVKKQLKAKEAQIVAERERLAGIIRDKKEPRDVIVETWVDYQNGTVDEIRVDTGELLGSRALQPHERQLPIPLKTDPEEVR